MKQIKDNIKKLYADIYDWSIAGKDETEVVDLIYEKYNDITPRW